MLFCEQSESLKQQFYQKFSSLFDRRQGKPKIMWLTQVSSTRFVQYKNKVGEYLFIFRKVQAELAKLLLEGQKWN